MKKASLIYQVILGIALVVLYILHFQTSPQTVSYVNTSDSLTIKNPESTTVYVNGDSLLENYEYFKKAKVDFEQRTSKTESEIVARRTALEKELATYQQTGAGMTQDQRAKAEESLVRKEQQLREYSEKAAQKLQDDQNEFNEGLFDKVADYLKEYSKGKNYKIVMNYTKGTGILFANDSLDITTEVLKGLNDNYKKENK